MGVEQREGDEMRRGRKGKEGGGERHFVKPIIQDANQLTFEENWE